MAAHTLLCVEPDEAALATIRGALEPYGFEITNITNGEEAVAWGRQNHPSLVIVSVEPRKVGYAICNKFKRSPELKDIPLILTSGEETPQQLEQHRKLKVKANEYLVKPFSLRDLVEKVREVYPLNGEHNGKMGTGDEHEVDSDDEDILLSSEVLEEISIADSDIVDEGDHAEVVVEAGEFDEESTQAVSPPALDDVFDSETDAAFAAIQQQEGPAPVSPLKEARSESPWSFSPPGWQTDDSAPPDLREDEVEDALAKLSDPPTDAVGHSNDRFASMQIPAGAASAASLDLDAEDDLPINGGSSRGQGGYKTPSPGYNLPAYEDDEDEAVPFGRPASEGDTGAIAEVMSFDAPSAGDAGGAAVIALMPQHAAAGTSANGASTAHNDEALEAFRQKLQQAEAEGEALRAELESLRVEKRSVDSSVESLRSERDQALSTYEQLSREFEEIKSRPQTSGSARDREILNLREVINKKERDLLDVRDQLDARERQILDHKDRIRENERSRRDLEDKNLGLEKALMDINERIDAISIDKQKGADREKVLKARLDDAHVEIQKAHDEVESLKKRGAATEERLRAEMDRARGELEGRMIEMEEAHRNELSQAAEERANAEATLEQEHHSTLSRMRVAHATELETTQKKASEELAALDERMQSEILRMRKDQDKSMASLKEEHALQLAAEREAHQSALEAKERDHRNEILGMRRRHEGELRAADERRQKELEDAELRSKLELETAENRRRSELQARDEQHNAQVADMDRRQFEEKTQTAERHRGEMDEAHARAARAEGDLAARTEELSEAHRRIAGLEADLDSTRADLRDREVKLSQNNLRVAELELKTTQYEEQIMRSYQRLRSDDKVMEKAKRALAVALSLLEERGSVPNVGGGNADEDGRAHEAPEATSTNDQTGPREVTTETTPSREGSAS